MGGKVVIEYARDLSYTLVSVYDKAGNRQRIYSCPHQLFGTFGSSERPIPATATDRARPRSGGGSSGIAAAFASDSAAPAQQRRIQGRLQSGTKHKGLMSQWAEKMRRRQPLFHRLRRLKNPLRLPVHESASAIRMRTRPPAAAQRRLRRSFRSRLLFRAVKRKVRYGFRQQPKALRRRSIRCRSPIRPGWSEGLRSRLKNLLAINAIKEKQNQSRRPLKQVPRPPLSL